MAKVTELRGKLGSLGKGGLKADLILSSSSLLLV